MIMLRRGDRGPLVLTVQLLLCVHLERTIARDGLYGPETRRAVLDFQRSRRSGGLAADGIAGPDTWSELTGRTNYRVVNAVDVMDPLLLEKSVPSDLIDVGGNPVLTGGMSGGVRSVVDGIIARSSGAGSLLLLRFIGHGSAGVMGVSSGIGGYYDEDGEPVSFHSDQHQASITTDNLDTIRPILRRLRHYFSPVGCVELHGCGVARQADGARLQQRLTGLWGVPVSAGRGTQKVGGLWKTLRMEGSVVTRYPAAGGLRGWARRHQSLPGGMSV